MIIKVYGNCYTVCVGNNVAHLIDTEGEPLAKDEEIDFSEEAIQKGLLDGILFLTEDEFDERWEMETEEGMTERTISLDEVASSGIVDYIHAMLN